MGFYPNKLTRKLSTWFGRTDTLQLPGAIGPTPLKHLMRVHTLGLRHSCHALPWLKCQLNNPPLLRDRMPHTNLRRFHAPIVSIWRAQVQGGDTKRLHSNHFRQMYSIRSILS